MQSSTQFTELLSLKKTSETLKVHPNTLRQWDKKGILKAIRFGDRKDRHYKKEDVLRFLDSKFNGLDIPKEQQDHNYQSFVDRKTMVEQAFDKLSCIQNITSSLSRSITTEEVFDVFLEQLMNALEANRVAIFELSKATNRLSCLANKGFPLEYIKEAESISQHDKSLYLDVLRTGEPIIIETYNQLSSLVTSGQLVAAVSDHSFAVLPLSTNYRPMAALGISFNNQRSFGKEDLMFMLTLARQCALAFERARLFENERLARLEAENTQKLLQSIHDSSIKFLVPLTPEETHRTIVNEAVKLMLADYGSLFLNIRNKVKKVYTTFPVLYKVGSRPQGFGNRALNTRQILINHIDEHEYHKLLYDVGIKTIIYIPMIYKNCAIGLITLNFLKHRDFDEKELNILRLFGSLASLAIERIHD